VSAVRGGFNGSPQQPQYPVLARLNYEHPKGEEAAVTDCNHFQAQKTPVSAINATKCFSVLI